MYNNAGRNAALFRSQGDFNELTAPSCRYNRRFYIAVCTFHNSPFDIFKLYLSVHFPSLYNRERSCICTVSPSRTKASISCSFGRFVFFPEIFSTNHFSIPYFSKASTCLASFCSADETRIYATFMIPPVPIGSNFRWNVSEFKNNLSGIHFSSGYSATMQSHLGIPY